MKILQIKETCIYIHDLEKAKEFYHDKLGFPIIGKREGRHIFFRAGTSVLLCFIPEITKEETTLPPHFAYGKQHIAFEVRQAEYIQWLEKIKALHIKITHVQTWTDALKSFYFEDYEGHVLEIVPEGIWE